MKFKILLTIIAFHSCAAYPAVDADGRVIPDEIVFINDTKSDYLIGLDKLQSLNPTYRIRLAAGATVQYIVNKSDEGSIRLSPDCWMIHPSMIWAITFPMQTQEVPHEHTRVTCKLSDVRKAQIKNVFKILTACTACIASILVAVEVTAFDVPASPLRAFFEGYIALLPPICFGFPLVGSLLTKKKVSLASKIAVAAGALTSASLTAYHEYASGSLFGGYKPLGEFFNTVFWPRQISLESVKS